MRSIRNLAGKWIGVSGRKPWVLALFSAAVFGSTLPGPDLLNWPDCPPGAPYGLGTDPRTAHFQTSPVAGPSGGTCSLDVVTGAIFTSAANTAGGVAFGSEGEVAGATYTLAFDLQWVKGHSDWTFSNENGSGDVNGLKFEVPFPGDRCWHHYEYTAPLGPAGPKEILFVYQGRTRSGFEPTLEEMRIDNMTLREVKNGTRAGLSIHDDSYGRGGECFDEHWRD